MEVYDMKGKDVESFGKSPPMTLIEQVEVLKQELGLEGKDETAKQLLEEAAKQLNVPAEGGAQATLTSQKWPPNAWPPLGGARRMCRS